ncbi:transposable element tc1 transposase protein [Rutstroemia sp. NJR-2017a BVV2]|nr:transposable element tc1 transposase protein [Rutstroemia sp. NJR-2017a BVV2]
MESVPTPKQPRRQRHKELSRDDRLRIHTLYYSAGLTRDQICLQTGATYTQVCKAIQNPPTPQKRRCGAKPHLNTPQRKRLIEWVSASRENREILWPAIPAILGWNCGEKAIRTAFEKEGFIRAISQKKPALSEQNKADRIRWAQEHLDWTEDQWDSICWSDETWVQPGKHRKTWITRRKGPSEIYHPDCVQPGYQRKIGWMFWGTISSKYGRYKGVFWEKD